MQDKNPITTQSNRLVMLPPGIEELSGITYGELTLSVKKLNYLDVLRKEGNVRVRFNFFGERGAEHILVPTNASANLTQHFKSSYKYLIGSNIWHFSQYLLDMQTLTLSIVDHKDLLLGLVYIHLEQFIEENISQDTKSVFGKLRGNFTIVSPRDENQKIGSIEVAMESNFDVTISRFIQEAETKYLSGEISMPIEEYIQSKLLKKQTNRTIDFGGDDSADRTRIPNSLIPENQSQLYNAELYASDMFLKEQEKIEDGLKEKANKSQIFQRRLANEKEQLRVQEADEKRQKAAAAAALELQAKKNKQLAMMNQSESGYIQIPKQMQSTNNNNFTAAAISQQASSSQTKFNGQDKRISALKNQFKENSSFKNSPSHSMLAQQSNMNSVQDHGISSPQSGSIRELERVNRDMSNKVQKLVNIGQQFFQEYAETKQSEEMFKAQRQQEKERKENLRKQEVEMLGKRQATFEKTLLAADEKQNQMKVWLAAEMKAQREGNVKALAKESTREEELKKKAAGMKQDQSQKVKVERPFPINAAIFDKNVLKVQILNLTCTNEEFVRKLKQEKHIFVENTIPLFFKSINGDSPVFKQATKTQGDMEFIFNAEHRFSVMVDALSVQNIASQKFQFDIKAFRLPRNTVEIGQDAEFVEAFAEGELNVTEYIARSQNFVGLFHIPIYSKISTALTDFTKPIPQPPVKDLKSLDAKGKTVVAAATATTDKKKDQVPVRKPKDQIGFLKVSITLMQINETDPRQTYVQHQEMNTFKQAIAVQIQPTAPKHNFQLYLHLGRLNILNPSKFLESSMFASFKIYGTSESIQTSEIPLENIKQYPNGFDSGLVISAPIDIVKKMRKVPLMIELWMRREGASSDQLFGLMTIPLVMIPKSVLDKSDCVNENWCGDTSSKQLIILSDALIDIKPLGIPSPDTPPLGALHTLLVFGTQSQIAKYQMNINYNSKQSNYNNTNTFDVKNQSQGNAESIKEKMIKKQQYSLARKEELLELQQEDIKKDDFEKQIGNIRQVQENVDFFHPDISITLLQEEEKLKSQNTSSNNNNNNKGSTKKNNQKKDYQFGMMGIPEQLIDVSQILIEVFEALRVNQKKIQQRIREFMHALKPPYYFLKSTDLYHFLASLPIKWKTQADLIVFARAFDIANVGYFNSNVFTKSFAAYVAMEAQNRNKFNALLVAFRDILRINRVTISELEHMLVKITEFGFCKKEQFINGILGLKLAGLDEELLLDIFYYLAQEKTSELMETSNTDKLVNLNCILDYLKEVQSFNKIAGFTEFEEEWFRKCILNNLKDRIIQGRIKIGVLLNSQTQNHIMITTKTLIEIFEKIGIDLSFYESYLLLKEIAVLSDSNFDAKDSPLDLGPQNLSITVLNLNMFLSELESALIFPEIDEETHGIEIIAPISAQKQLEEQQEMEDLAILLNQQQQHQKPRQEQISLSHVRNKLKMQVSSLSGMQLPEEFDGVLAYLRYIIPTQDSNWIDSNVFEISSEIRQYNRISLKGVHSFVLKDIEDFIEVFNSNTLRFELVVAEDNSVIAAGDMDIVHLQEISKTALSNSTRIIPLPLTRRLSSGDSQNYNSGVELNKEAVHLGYANIKLEFSKEKITIEGQHQEILQENEQNAQRLIPKHGFLSVIASVEPISSAAQDGLVDENQSGAFQSEIVKEIVSKYNLEFSPFVEDSYLNHLFKPMNTTTTANRTSKEGLNASQYLTMSPNIIAYLQESEAMMTIWDANMTSVCAQHSFSLIQLLLQGEVEENVALVVAPETNHEHHVGLKIRVTYSKAVDDNKKGKAGGEEEEAVEQHLNESQ